MRPSDSRSRLLADAADIKVVMIAPDVNQDVLVINESSRRLVVLKIDNGQSITADCKAILGFHLSKSKWDPYPWVGHVDAGSIADLAGLRAGDCLLDINGTDLIGLRVKDVASLIQNDVGNNAVRIEVWRSFPQKEADIGEGAALAGPLPEVAKKLANAVSGAVRALECPVCLESATSPVSQCVHGHILCVSCRAKTPRCPVCRVRLGQGRCLLADEVQRNIRAAFEETDVHNATTTNLSLREKLFGNKRSSNVEDDGCNSLRIALPKAKPSIARLLLGGFDKAASAENLSSSTLSETGTAAARPVAYRRLGELCRIDRTKSASTGELSRGDEIPTTSSFYRHSTNRDHVSTSGLLSVPQTPTWGGSTESVNNASFSCPLSRTTGCKEFVSVNFVLEHLARSHEGVQVHFNGKSATIPLPLPFGPNSSYVFRHRGELFFFQYENESAWVSGTDLENPGEWSVLGKNGDGTEVKVRRRVAKLDDNSAPLPCHLAPLPKALSISDVVVELLDSRHGEDLQV